MSMDIVRSMPADDEYLTKGMRIEQYLQKYEMRYNIVKGCLERKNSGRWLRMTDRTVNSLARELRDVTYVAGYSKQGEPIIKTLEINPNSLLKNLESDYLRETDPIKDYLLQLEVNNVSSGEIRKFTDVFEVADWYGPKEKKYISTYWTKWLVGSVANALNDDNCYNHLCIVLVGEQGLKKGFLIEELLPLHMKEYIKTDGNFDPRNKDSVVAIAQYFILHLDDMLKRVNLRDYNEIKNAITRPDIKVRKSYGKLEEVMPHRASFIATVNDKEFITDLTGARRFMPFELASIDWEEFKKVDMDKVWGEALELYRNKFEYWVTREEENSLSNYKKHFMVELQVQNLLTAYFIPWNENQHSLAEREMMTTTMILEKLFEFSTITNLSDKKLGSMLKNEGFEQKRYRLGNNPNPVRCYAVVYRHSGAFDNLEEWIEPHG
tara:strand:- start:844 stop:2151 length:1308 start_codon:yes stop_codon:yes gene_type:complete